MANELYEAYKELRRELGERGIGATFLQVINREKNTSKVVHGISSPDGYFMYSDGTVERNFFDNNEVIHVKQENDVFRGRENLFIRMTYQDFETAVLRYEDGLLFKRVKDIHVPSVLPARLSIEPLKMVLPFDFLVTDIVRSYDGVEITCVGEHAYMRKNHIVSPYMYDSDEAFANLRLVPYRNVWRQDEKEARVRFNLEGGNDHVRVLKND